MNAHTLDTSDIDRYLGKPLEFSPLREPIANNDIRRWVHAMHYPNLLHYDPAFSSASRFGKLVAPQSFPIACDDGHGAGPACVGKIPDSHLLFGGVTTEVCVQTSMREANDRGYEGLLLEDCTESYFPQFKAAAIEMIRAQGAIVGWTAPSSALHAALAAG